MANGTFGGGTGVSGDPYLIEDLLDLDAVRNNLSAYYELANDIDAADTVNWNSGAGWDPIGNGTNKFIGHFDGKGHKIIGLYINKGFTDYAGLFGYSGTGFMLCNVSLIDVNIRGNNGSAAHIANSYGGTIENCYSTGVVYDTSYYGGGIAGYAAQTRINNCYSLCKVTSVSHYVGGLVAYAFSCTLNNCYSCGAVYGYASYIGGLIGYVDVSSTITNSYWDTETSGQSTSAGGTGLTTAQMKQQASFVGWDFDTVWTIDEGVSYPELQVFAEEPIQSKASLTGVVGTVDVVTDVVQLQQVSIELPVLTGVVGELSLEEGPAPATPDEPTYINVPYPEIADTIARHLWIESTGLLPIGENYEPTPPSNIFTQQFQRAFKGLKNFG
jgi:hypothetical protein